MALTSAQQEAFLTKHKALLGRQRGLLEYSYGQLWSFDENEDKVFHTNEDGTLKMGVTIYIAHPNYWVHRDRGPIPQEDVIGDCLDGVPIMRAVMGEAKLIHGNPISTPDREEE